MMIGSCRRFFLVVVCVCSLVSAANAADLYNNLSTSAGGADPVANESPALADSFSTGSIAFTLDDVKLNLILIGPASPSGSITVDLLSDNSTSPGSLLTTIGTIADSAVSAAEIQAYDFSSFTPQSLTADTRYWIEVTGGDNTTNINWVFASDLSGTGVVGEYNVNAASGMVEQNSADNLPYEMSVSGTPTATIPEPASIMLLGLGLGAIAVARRFRGRSAA